MTRLSPSEAAEFLDDAFCTLLDAGSSTESLIPIWGGYFTAQSRAEMPQTLETLNETWPQKRGTP